MADISLTQGIRANLISLQNTSALLTQTQERLATGRKVNSALDNPASFFTATALQNRANDLNGRLDGISKAVQTVKAADVGIKGISSLISQLKGIVTDAQGTTSTAERQTLQSRFNEVLRQISELSEDSGFDGVNLLDSGTLTVQLGQKAGDATLGLTGFSGNATAADLAIGTQGAGFTDSAVLTAAFTTLEAAETTLRNQSRELSSNLGILTTREEFTKNLISTLEAGADRLVLADTNEEAANLLALNTQQQLGINALSLASQSAQSVLRLLG